jgi:hypothetical protein
MGVTPQIYIALAIAAASATTGFGTAWKIQSMRADAKELEHVQSTLRATELAAQNAARLSKQLADAQNSAALRERGLRADAASSRASALSLSHVAAEALRRADTTHTACRDVANTQNVVLNQCVGKYRAVAEDADRAISDRQTLIDAWPK